MASGNKIAGKGDFEKAANIAPFIVLVIMFFLYGVLIRSCNSFDKPEGAEEGHGHGGGHHTEAAAPAEVTKEETEEVIATDTLVTDSVMTEEVKAEEAGAVEKEEKKAE